MVKNSLIGHGDGLGPHDRGYKLLKEKSLPIPGAMELCAYTQI